MNGMDREVVACVFADDTVAWRVKMKLRKWWMNFIVDVREGS